MSARASRSLAWLGLALSTAACELTEVTTARGDDVLVVEAVLREGADSQRVVLHRGLVEGRAAGVPGATVVVRTEAGREIVFAEAPLFGCVDASPGQVGPDPLVEGVSCYLAAGGEPWVRPGGTYELRVETPAGEVARGRTTVPGAFELRVPAVERCTLPAGTQLPLTWTASAGAWVYVTQAQVHGLREALSGSGIEGIPEPLELTGLSISEQDTTLVLPSEIGLFERRSGSPLLLRLLQQGFPANVGIDVAVVAADRNWVNSVRGGNFNPSGAVRVSSVVGDAVGVFGSLVPRRFTVRIGDRGGDPCLVPGPGGLPR